MTNKRTPRQGNYCPDCTDHEHTTARSSGKSDSTWVWIVAAILLAGGGGTAAAGAVSGSSHSPAPRDTVCTKYYKGGC